MRRFVALLFLVLSTVSLHAQQPAIDFLSRIGEIYVVVACIAVIFLGIVFYLVRLDSKLTKLEQHINDEQ